MKRMPIISYDSSLYLYIQFSIYKKTADSAHCSVIYFAIFSSSISHSDVTYLKNQVKEREENYENYKEK